MRIVAGSLGGRTFESPKSFKTHPMSEKMRGAIFNTLGELNGLTVLDAFAGSGALGFEAISRGAAQVTAIDVDKSAQRVIQANIKTLGLGQKVKLISASVSAWLSTNQTAQFDVVLCDPPYNDLQPQLLQKLASTVKSGGLLVLSWPTNGAAPPEMTGLTLLSTRAYGDATAYFYRAV